MEYPLETSFYVTDKESIENGNFEKYPWKTTICKSIMT